MVPARHAVIGLCLLTLTGYLGVLRAGFVYDDVWTIEHNAAIRSFARVPALLRGELVRTQTPDAWRPLVVISHMLDYRLFGLRPLGYHLHSLAWHLGCVLLGFALARRLLGRPALALTAAALFAVHPLHVEAVAAVNFREDLIAACLALAALLVLAPAPDAGERPRGALWRLPAAAAFALLALAAKETAIVLPLLQLVLALLVPSRGALRRALPGAAALGVAVGLYLLWRLHAGGLSPYPEELASLPWPTSAEGTLRTLAQLVVPLGLSPEYEQPARAWLSLAGLASVLGLLAILLASVWAHARGAAVEAVGLLWLLLAWLPTSGLLGALPNVRADRYAYLPSLGACLAAAALLERLRAPRARLAATGLAIAPLLVVSWLQVEVWRSERSLWQRAVATAPASARAWAGLARAQAAAGELAAAGSSAERALRLAPASGDVHLVLANVRARERRFADALPRYARAAELPIRHPGHLYTSWGLALFLAGRPDAAERTLRTAVARAPELAEAHAQLARVLAARGRHEEARAARARAVELAPELRRERP
jgi:tetratricopeptide (TPR) repeat protein